MVGAVLTLNVSPKFPPMALNVLIEQHQGPALMDPVSMNWMSVVPHPLTLA